MNTITGAWANFSGWPVTAGACTAMKFTSSEYLCWKSLKTGRQRRQLVAPALGAFNYFGSSSALKTGA